MRAWTMAVVLGAAAMGCGGGVTGDGDEDAAVDGDAGPEVAADVDAPAEDAGDEGDTADDGGGADAPESAYPKLNMFIWGGASAAWYAEFDFAISGDSQRLAAAKVLNPDLLVSHTRDINQCGEHCPAEWRVLDANGENIPVYGYGGLGDTSRFCGQSGGATYRDFIVDLVEGQDWDLVDGFNSDGVWADIGSWLTPAGIDLNRDGVHDSVDTSAWREGRLALFAEMRAALPPGKFITVNGMNDFWRHGADNLNGVMFEKFMVFASWPQFLDIYGYYAENAREPHMTYVNNHCYGDTGIERRAACSKENFRFMRFGLTATLLHDGYYSYNDEVEGSWNEHWYVRYYDEYDVPLYEPLGPFATIRPDVFCRFFEGGVSIVNGSTTAQTISEGDLRTAAASLGLDWNTIAGEGEHYYRFAGQQDPEFNDGSLFTSVTLPSQALEWDRRKGDGIVLVRRPGQVVAAAVIVDTEEFVTSPSARSAALTGFTGSCGNPVGGEGFRTGHQLCAEPDYPFHGYHLAPTGGGATATFAATLRNPGRYRVLEYHPRTDGSDVPHTLTHADGDAVFRVDQRADAEQWNELGVYRFGPGSPARVVVSTSGASGTQIAADAIRFEWVGAAP